MMDRPSTSENPLFEEHEETHDYVTKGHLFGVQRALHQESEALTCVTPKHEQGTTSTPSFLLKWRNCATSWSTAPLPRLHPQDGVTQVDTLRILLHAQVHLEHVLIGATIMTIIKLHKIHSMAMGYKTAFEHENVKRAKAKYHHVQDKMTKTATPSGKNYYAEKNKHLKRNVLSEKQLMP
jgi:hypothetical protein